MCTALFELQEYETDDGQRHVRLIVLHNRDEWLTRDTAPCAWWAPPDGTIFAPRDLIRGGTWMGIRKEHAIVRAAFLTNIRYMPPVHGKLSRGNVIKDFLEGTMSTASYLKELEASGHLYPGFNLIVFDGASLGHLCNFVHGEYVTESSLLKPNVIYGMSNGPFSAPWPKVVQAKEAMAACDRSGPAMEICHRLLPIMANSQRIQNEDELPKTGHTIEMEFKLSSLFVETKEPHVDYCTRTMIAMVLDSNPAEDCCIVEKDLALATHTWMTRSFTL
ncbi:hypothetical protein SDRG_01779 [Saprolegnia diclina VS20]|uniref:Uncharacterized protein n=1 Tax=Saprolegnia diclina (strain VS20) TaxID=1156394 RepID=T0R171_SAPDV|nr:hypothetical protein SDRG_01779 [Saprolegnia diclina VS20]EQC40706.1 hypothetical protein SDRG_01779 [Saprolegnia diclina VS20]|eukprot:XP_008605550.1 hypothetical protein SDRG_01779 [Saprolegnia diclina VS20]